MYSMTNKQCLVYRIICLTTMMSFLLAIFYPSTSIAQEKIQVPVGTSVTLRTISTLSPESLNVGDTVELAVVSDVVIDGKVVIKAGAVARGEITASKDRNLIGIAAKIGLALRHVEAVDGSMIPLSGSKIVEGKDKMVMSIGLALVCCILFALVKGGEATLPSGTHIQTNVASSITVTVQ